MGSLAGLCAADAGADGWGTGAAFLFKKLGSQARLGRHELSQMPQMVEFNQEFIYGGVGNAVCMIATDPHPEKAC